MISFIYSWTVRRDLEIGNGRCLLLLISETEIAYQVVFVDAKSEGYMLFKIRKGSGRGPEDFAATKLETG